MLTLSELRSFREHYMICHIILLICQHHDTFLYESNQTLDKRYRLSLDEKKIICITRETIQRHIYTIKSVIKMDIIINGILSKHVFRIN